MRKIFQNNLREKERGDTAVFAGLYKHINLNLTKPCTMEEETTYNMAAFVSLTLSNANNVVCSSVMCDFPLNYTNEFTCGS